MSSALMTGAVLPLVLGAVVGAVLGLTGAGGGVLAVPALVLGLGWQLPEAAPTALMAVGAAAALGASDGLKKRQVRWRAALLMAAVGSLFSPVGTIVAQHLRGPALTVVFSLAMLVVAVRLWRSANPPHAKAPARAARDRVCRVNPATGRLHWSIVSGLAIAAIGAASGFCTGLLGVGGGFIIVPSLRQFSDIDMHQIVATSLLVIALISAVTVVLALANGVAIPLQGAYFVGGCLAGMAAGRVLIRRLNAGAVLRTFALVMIAIALALLARSA